MSSILKRVYTTLPRELIIIILDHFTVKERQDLKNQNPIVIDDLLAQERSQDAIEKNRLACFTCLKMLPRWKFSSEQTRKKKRRNGNKQRNRCCIECSVKAPRRGGEIISMTGKDIDFVVCTVCECLGRLREVAGRTVMCESCADGRPRVPRDVMLNEIWRARKEEVDP